MEYIIGIDGGGTKTQCIIANQKNEVLFKCTGKPSTFLMLGTETVAETILELIQKCAENLLINLSDIAIVLLGTTGAGRRPDAERLETAFNQLCKSKNIEINFRVESDARIAIEGAFSGKPGSILIAGTGSIMFGKDSEGNVQRTGGFGRYIGDQGSGYMIGRKGLIAVSKDFDGRGNPTLISKFLLEKFNIDSPEKLITEIYKNNFDIASAAPLVLDAAGAGDEAALSILEEEAEELVVHIATMYKKLNEPVLNLAFIGGIISGDNDYSKILKEKINKNLPKINLIKPEHPPEMGAIFMARDILASKEAADRK
jgi:N-acetylglucosamine kinase-like BadF-type ATPase